MATFLFDQIIFGPVKSRRLGTSLGINLLPKGRKICNFNCVYCECGWTTDSADKDIPTRNEIRAALDQKLSMMKMSSQRLNAITFAGNGEPTIHPDFSGIIDDTVELRKRYFPNVRIAVLSNSTMLKEDGIINSLLKVDDRILKLDSAIDSTLAIINQSKSALTVDMVVEGMKKFNGRFTLQTLFLKGKIDNHFFDNTSNEELSAWYEKVRELRPEKVMIYTFSRETPHPDLEKIPIEKLDSIAEGVRALGIDVQVSG